MGEQTAGQLKRMQTSIFLSRVLFRTLLQVFRTSPDTLVIHFTIWRLLRALFCLSCQLKASGPGPRQTYQSSSHAIKDKKKTVYRPALRGTFGKL